MKLPLALLASVAFLAMAPALPAQAAPLIFTFTGTNSATFQLDSNPTPTSSNTTAFTSQTFFDNVAGTFGGVAGTANINFGSGLAAAFNLSNATLGNLQLSGTTVFTGTSASPVFSPGVFTLSNPFFGINDTLTITAAPGASAAPEPGTWALMFAGVGMMGAALRYGRARRNASLAA